VNIDDLRVTREQGRWKCDPDQFAFDTTADLEPIDSFIGQDRAVSALEFGLGLDTPGYNIFVTGLTGTGKSTVIQTHLAEAVSNGYGGSTDLEVFDWCYVYNFRQTDSPVAIRLPAGNGRQFVESVDGLLATLRRELPEAFATDEYKSEVRLINEAAFEKRSKRVVEAERMAKEHSFAVQLGSTGIAVIPIIDDKPMDQTTFNNLPDEEQNKMDEARRQILASLDEAMDDLRTIEVERVNQTEALDKKIVENVVSAPFTTLKETFASSSEASDFLDGLKDYSMQNVGVFRAPEAGQQQAPMPTMVPLTRIQQDPLLPYKVNLHVDNSGVHRKQIVVEDNPTYAHLFGRIERPPAMESRSTDHTMLKAGSLVQASGGFLVLEVREVLSQPAVWSALKRVLREQEVRPEDPAEIFAPGFFSQGLRPAPIPIDVKVVMSGEPEIYSLLATHDPDFWQVFKIRADLDFQTNINDERLMEYARFISGLCASRGIAHFSREATAAVIEQAARMVDNQHKLSARFGLLADLVVEASHRAKISKESIVTPVHVKQALEGRIERSSRISDTIREMMLEGTLIVDLDGEHIGQVNGLSVYGDGDVMFGRPSKITVRSFMGMQGVVNVEREVELTGRSHDKGVLILAGYLGATFAKKTPLSVNVSIVFEQSYGLIDGDSASSTELYAILSSLSGLPIRQNIAVTGSINQFGEVQPIGGVNEKIEGYFDFCKASDKLGSAGVIIPKRNLANLMLRDDVLDAMDKGEFHVYAVGNVDEGIEILTGVEAGSLNDEGEYPAESVNGRVNAQFIEYAVGLREFGSTPAQSQQIALVEITETEENPDQDPPTTN